METTNTCQVVRNTARLTRRIHSENMAFLESSRPEWINDTRPEN